MEVQLPPLSLYIHFPWCVRKCPYCDFNSHELKASLDESDYVKALLADLDRDLQKIAPRPLQSIFMGGGTPSLFSPHAIAQMLAGVKERVACTDGMEVSMEANPGTLEAAHFSGYRDAGVNRLSIGVQSFDAGCLEALGRIHGPDEAYRAAELARQAGFERINLDLMFGLPRQSAQNARADVTTALELNPGHISYYQLTLEPNTAFHHAPPPLPDEELIWQIQEQGQSLLGQAGYAQYEISAYAKDGQRCRHNLNYWTFGDYLGIGAGAHGKITNVKGQIRRTTKLRHPRDYLSNAQAGNTMETTWSPSDEELPLEFMMNWLRLHEGFSRSQFEDRTRLPFTSVARIIQEAVTHGLVVESAGEIVSTHIGRRFLNDLLALFTPG
ncbi:MAG: radical SAM family heme chaperone HemW [Pseudomonadota bacterium]